MKHVPSGHEEREPARDRTQEEKTARDGTPKKDQCQRQATVPIGSGSIVYTLTKDASENRMRVVKSETLVMNSRVAESCDRLVVD